MKKSSFIVMLIAFAALSAISACGGGGGGGGSTATQPTTATVILKSSGNATIYGIDVTVDLPSGVTLKSTTNPPQVDTGVVTASGTAASNTLVTAVYTPATASASGTVRVLLANASGFSAGEYCTVNGVVATGYSPKATDFSVASFAASDQNGGVITGLTPSYTATVK